MQKTKKTTGYSAGPATGMLQCEHVARHFTFESRFQKSKKEFEPHLKLYFRDHKNAKKSIATHLLPVEQWLGHMPSDREVVGSNPTQHFTFETHFQKDKTANKSTVTDLVPVEKWLGHRPCDREVHQLAEDYSQEHISALLDWPQKE